MTAKDKMDVVRAARKVALTLPKGDHKHIRKGYIAYKDPSGQAWLLGNDLKFIDAIIDDTPAKKL